MKLTFLNDKVLTEIGTLKVGDFYLGASGSALCIITNNPGDPSERDSSVCSVSLHTGHHYWDSPNTKVYMVRVNEVSLTHVVDGVFRGK